MKALISCDYSTAGEHVLSEAKNFLHAFPNAEVHVYTVIDINLVSSAGLATNGELMNSLELDARELGNKARILFGDRKINFAYEVGNPAEKVLEKLKSLHADLLILGTHGRTGLNRMMIGSVAESILRQVNCNTLVIPVKNK